MKVSELTGAALDWAVAQCEGETQAVQFSPLASSKYYYAPSRKWAQGGPIIERDLIRIVAPSIRGSGWTALIQHHPIVANNWSQGFGPTPLIAAMRSYVASKLGNDIEVPEELK